MTVIAAILTGFAGVGFWLGAVQIDARNGYVGPFEARLIPRWVAWVLVFVACCHFVVAALLMVGVA